MLFFCLLALLLRPAFGKASGFVDFRQQWRQGHYAQSDGALQWRDSVWRIDLRLDTLGAPASRSLLWRNPQGSVGVGNFSGAALPFSFHPLDSQERNTWREGDGSLWNGLWTGPVGGIPLRTFFSTTRYPEQNMATAQYDLVAFSQRHTLLVWENNDYQFRYCPEFRKTSLQGELCLGYERHPVVAHLASHIDVGPTTLGQIFIVQKDSVLLPYIVHQGTQDNPTRWSYAQDWEYRNRRWLSKTLVQWSAREKSDQLQFAQESFYRLPLQGMLQHKGSFIWNYNRSGTVRLLCALGKSFGFDTLSIALSSAKPLNTASTESQGKLQLRWQRREKKIIIQSGIDACLFGSQAGRLQFFHRLRLHAGSTTLLCQVYRDLDSLDSPNRASIQMKQEF